MALNTPEVQILGDGGQTTTIKITGYYSASNSANTPVVNTANLRFANTSQLCLVSISKLQYATDVANGAVQLYWEGATNAAIASFGTNAGKFDAYLTNNATTPTGNLGIQTIGLGNGDSYNFVITLNKESGFANAMLQYDWNGQKIP